MQTINILSLKLQQESVTLGKAVNLIESVIDTFENSHSNESWDRIWEQIKEFLKTNNVSIDTGINGNIYFSFNQCLLLSEI